MSVRFPVNPRLLVLALLLVVFGRPAGDAAAQIPAPSRNLSVFAGESTDGQGIVVTWSVAPFALGSDFFSIFRRRGDAPFGSGQQIAVVGRTVRGYTDYGVDVAGIWCYQIASVADNVFTFASPETCAAFLPGVLELPGATRPVFAAGCARFFQTQPAGTPAAAISARFNPPGSLVSLWRYDATLNRLVAGYFANASGPVDFTVLPVSNEYEFACLATAATYG